MAKMEIIRHGNELEERCRSPSTCSSNASVDSNSSNSSSGSRIVNKSRFSDGKSCLPRDRTSSSTEDNMTENKTPTLVSITRTQGYQSLVLQSSDTNKKENNSCNENNVISSTTIALLSFVTWVSMILVPIILSSPYSPVSYRRIFPSEWYDHGGLDQNELSRIDEDTSCAHEVNNGNDNTSCHLWQKSNHIFAKPLGLCLGIVAVSVGQLFILMLFYLYKSYCKPPRVQRPTTQGERNYDFYSEMLTHLGQLEGFVLLAFYLSVTWMLRLLPPSYYIFDGTIQFDRVMMCLLSQDFLQYTMHRLEHSLSAAIYRHSHKPHHRFTNPKLFDAFNGSLTDTILMVLIPLYITNKFVVTDCNVWTYMAFGSFYANWLTLIHSEHVLPWDESLFVYLGWGTPSDHHVHHKFFIYNYGHLFMYWDFLGGTYRNPKRMFQNKKI